MRERLKERTVVVLSVLLALVAAQRTVRAQSPPTFIPDIRFATGRGVVPYLEGWLKNPDGTFDFVFGYLNRNTEEELTIPVGPGNSVMPDGPDRGQPTYFHTRRHPRIFRVRVPADWGDKAITWSITANGVTEKVVSKLLVSEEINERMLIANGNNTMRLDEEDPNQPPNVAIPPVGEPAAGAPVTLTALVTDDGLPKPRAPVAGKPTAPASRFQSQRNSTSNAMVGLRLTWVVYRGPAKVMFDTNPIRVTTEKTVTTAHFFSPGTYRLIAIANDGRLSTQKEVTVTVK